MTIYDCTHAIRIVPGISLKDIAGAIEMIRQNRIPIDSIQIKHCTITGEYNEVYIEGRPC